MTVGEFITELQKLDPNLTMMYSDDITGDYLEVAGAPYQCTFVELKGGGVLPKQELLMWDNVEVVKEFEAVSL